MRNEAGIALAESGASRSIPTPLQNFTVAKTLAGSKISATSCLLRRSLSSTCCEQCYNAASVARQGAHTRGRTCNPQGVAGDVYWVFYRTTLPGSAIGLLWCHRQAHHGLDGQQ